MYVEGRLRRDPHQGFLLLSLEACSWHSLLTTAASISGLGWQMGASAEGCCVEARRGWEVPNQFDSEAAAWVSGAAETVDYFG